MCMCRLAVYVSAIYVCVCECVCLANGTENHPNCLARQAVAYFRFTFFLHCQGIAILSLMIFCPSFVVYVACGDGCDGEMVVLLLVKAFGISAIKLHTHSLFFSRYRLKGNAKRKIM